MTVVKSSNKTDK